MERYWIYKGIKMAILIVMAVFFFAYVVMELWNWLLPSILGVTSITFFQALGLLVLSRLLFGGFNKSGGMVNIITGNKNEEKVWKHDS